MDWQPDVLAAIAQRLGVPAGELAPPRSFALSAADGTRLHGLDWGGPGLPVLLLHGGGLTARTWDYVALGLRACARPIALDLRGHGDSGWSEQYTLSAFASDLDAVCDELAIARAHLVGMSLGGLVAAGFAARSGTRTASLTLVDVAPGVSFVATQRMRDFMSELGEVPSVEAAVELALAANPHGDRDRVLYRMRAMLKPTASGGWAWKRDSRRSPDYPDLLRHVEALAEQAPRIAAPCLLVRGGRSKVLSADAAAGFAARFAHGRWVELADAGHNVQEDNPRALISALRAFWGEAVSVA